jgi:hypothetical protein
VAHASASVRAGDAAGAPPIPVRPWADAMAVDPDVSPQSGPAWFAEEKLYLHAHELFCAGEWVDAARIFDHLAQLRPDFPLYREILGWALESLRTRGDGRIPRLAPGTAGSLPALELRSLEVLLRHARVGINQLETMRARLGARLDFQLLPLVAHPLADSAWLDGLNRWLGHHPLLAISPDVSGYLQAVDEPSARFTRLRFPGPTGHSSSPSKPSETPLVSVAMACFNNAGTLAAAVDSVLAQSEPALELIIVDDASSDGSAAIAAECVARDPRVRYLRNARNLGTYASRNRALDAARGRYFTVLDADDLALPDRLARQRSALESRPSALAVISRLVRMTGGGQPVALNVEAGGFVHWAVGTLMVRREAALAELGYWDEVRFEADSEYMNRLHVACGHDALHWQDDVVTLALHREDSLTRAATTGFDDLFGPSAIRQAYRDAWQQWHRSGTPLHLPRAPGTRPFPAPQEMLA